MRDYQAAAEKLRRDAAEAALIRDRAADEKKRDLFDRLCRHLNMLADAVERAKLMAEGDADAARDAIRGHDGLPAS